MKIKITVLTILCSSALWIAAQTNGFNDNHGFAAPGGSGAFVTPGKGFVTPGKGFIVPGHGFVAPGSSNRFVMPGNGFVTPDATNGPVPPGQGNLH